MIGYFPEPYPDELLYSVIARFAERMRFPSDSGLMIALFGRPHAVAIPDLPHSLEVLANALPEGHPATVDTLIDSHSLLPFYGPFLRTATYNEVRAAMKGSEDHSVRVRCGISTSRVRPPNYFRSCPVCDAENEAALKETYWSRHFQLTGVEVCVKHRVFLESTDLRMSPLPNRHQFISAKSSVRKPVPIKINPDNRAHQILLGLAQDTVWLLQQNGLNPGLDVIHDRYIETLRTRGLVTTKGGSIRITDLRREMETYFTPKLLDLLDSTITDTTTAGWLGKILHKHTSASAPLRHLLLLRFLGVRPQEFFYPDQLRSASKHQPASVSAWLCLNPVCEQYHKPIITEFSQEYMKKRKIDAAIFTCPCCRFAYGLYDWSKPANQNDFVRDYGPQWKKQLEKLWLDASVSVRHISKILAVDSKTVKSNALNLGLSFPRQGKRKATTRGIYKRKPVWSKLKSATQRQKWLCLRQSNPGFGTNEIRCLSPALFTWLYRHDRKWLQSNQPQSRQARPRRSRVDWAERDEEIAGMVATAALRIKNNSGKLLQVTTTAIGRAIGRQSLLEKNLDKLPYTSMIIQSLVESSEDFAVRRITQIAACLRLQVGLFERWQLVKAAGLRPATEKLPKIQAALNYETIHTLAA